MTFEIASCRRKNYGELFNRDGTVAEYVAVQGADLAHKPQTLNPYEAAAVPLAGLTAWQALFDHARLAAGQRILIHGAAGGVGTLAIQLAKWRRAEVIAATAANNLSLVLDLGANQAVDYWTAPFEKQVEPVNVILDTVGGDIQRRSWSILKPGGILVTIAGESISVPADVKDKKGIFFIVKPDTQQFIFSFGDARNPRLVILPWKFDGVRYQTILVKNFSIGSF